MRLIGMLGGMSPESTVLYYRFMNEAVRERTGDPAASARVLIHAVDFSALSALQRADGWGAVGAMMADAAQGLVAGGAELVVISANTMHIAAEAVRAVLPAGVELVHIGDVIAAAAAAAGASRVLLTGTAYTMERPFLREHLEASGLAVEIPAADDRAFLHAAIYAELTAGVVTQATLRRFRSLLTAAAQRGSEAVVLGCTELGMLTEDFDSPVALLDTARLHATAAVAAACAGDQAPTRRAPFAAASPSRAAPRR